MQLTPDCQPINQLKAIDHAALAAFCPFFYREAVRPELVPRNALFLEARAGFLAGYPCFVRNG